MGVVLCIRLARVLAAEDRIQTAFRSFRQFYGLEVRHPCYTHPKTIEVATEKARAFFEARSRATCAR